MAPLLSTMVTLQQQRAPLVACFFAAVDPLFIMIGYPHQRQNGWFFDISHQSGIVANQFQLRKFGLTLSRLMKSVAQFKKGTGQQRVIVAKKGLKNWMNNGCHARFQRVYIGYPFHVFERLFDDGTSLLWSCGHSRKCTILAPSHISRKGS